MSYDLAETQFRMGRWADDHLASPDGHDMAALAALKVAEEAGELAAAIVKPRDGAGRPAGHPGDEIADVILAALTCAEFLGVHAADRVARKLDELEARPVQQRLI